MAGTVAYIMIKAELGKAQYVAEEIVKIEGMEWAAVVTGPYDLLVGASASSSEALLELVANALGTIDGVTDIATALMDSWFQREGRGMHPIP